MSKRRLAAYIDALAAGRRPRAFRAEPEDAEVLRAAITLRAARAGEAAPQESFVAELFQQLSEQANPPPATAARPPAARRARIALAVAAAAATVIAGAVVTTVTLHHPASKSATTAQVPGDDASLRTGTFLTANDHAIGQIVAYRGHPSWVYLHVDVPSYTGPLVCMLQVDNGSTVAFGTFTVHDGSGHFSNTIGDVNVSHLQGARLVTPSGAPVASADFSA